MLYVKYVKKMVNRMAAFLSQIVCLIFMGNYDETYHNAPPPVSRLLPAQAK
jgi:hypothetical protein